MGRDEDVDADSEDAKRNVEGKVDSRRTESEDANAEGNEGNVSFDALRAPRTILTAAPADTEGTIVEGTKEKEKRDDTLIFTG